MDGVINVNKPAGWTSQDVCTKLKHVLHVKKIGHTGTLDPMATGVLPVCVGKATRIIEYYDRDIKSYRAVMKLGVTTDTLDMTGEVLETADHSQIGEKAVREAFSAYRGHVKQVPPRYSALRINGKRAYDLARQGADFEIKPREVIIYDNSLLRFDAETGEIEFEVSCSKGTYIRTICDDIGRALGCGGTMTALERTASGYFRIEEAHAIEEIIAAAGSDADLKSIIIPADKTLTNLGVILLDDNRVTAFKNGNGTYEGGFTVIQRSDLDGLFRVYAGTVSPEGFLGVAAIENGSLEPRKVLAV